MRKSLLLGSLILAALAIGRAEAAPPVVTSPNGGELWYVGSTQSITWTSGGTGAVKVFISRNGGASYDPTPIAQSVTNTNSATWVVTEPETTQARIRVQVGLSSNKDDSNANFTIEKALYSFAEESFTIPGDGSFTLGLVVREPNSSDPPAAQSYKYKYIYTLTSLDTVVGSPSGSAGWPDSYIGTFGVSNCKEIFLGLKPKKTNGAEDTTWNVNTWSVGEDQVVWHTPETKANGIGPTKQRLIFCVFTNRKPVVSNCGVHSLSFNNRYDAGKVFFWTFEYWTPGCSDDDVDEDEGCVHEYNLAQVYPADSIATLPGFEDMSCYKGDNPCPIPASKLAIPGVLCLATDSDGYLDWEAFISGNKGSQDDECCAYPYVQICDLVKVSPPSHKCPELFQGYTVRHYGYKNIRTWWPLAYTMPGTTFTLRLRGVCNEGSYKKKPYQEVYRWTVVANPDTFCHLIDLFHTNALGELEVPSIVGEDTYAALKECAELLKEAVKRLEEDPYSQQCKLDVCDAVMECEALVLCNTLFLDHLQAPEKKTFPYHHPYDASYGMRFLPGNLAIPDSDVEECADGCGGVVGIIDTEQNPVACKLMVDLEWIGEKYCGLGYEDENDYEDEYEDGHGH